MARVSKEIGLEQALRAALLAVEEARAEVLHHVARGEALADELRAALAGALDDERAAALEARLADGHAIYLEGLREADALGPRRLQLGDAVDKYALPPQDGPPCMELIPICRGRCCQFDHALSSQDLDEGVIEWDRGKPYLIKHGADGFCVHFDRDGRGCGEYAHRPALCRTYDCRKDPRIWIDYEQKIPAPIGVEDLPEWSTTVNLLDRLRRRDGALAAEAATLRRQAVPDVPDAPVAAPVVPGAEG